MDNDKLISYGIIDTRKSEKNLCYFSQMVSKLIDEYKPDFVAWENLKTNQNADTIRLLGEVTGILRYICQHNSIPYAEVVPISVKAKICQSKGTGKNGRKTKLDLARWICHIYNLEFPKNKRTGEDIKSESNKFFNITDAIGIAYFCYLTGLKGESRKSGEKTSKSKKSRVNK